MSAQPIQPNTFQLTPNPSELDVQLQALVDTYGLGALGESLAHQYGKTRVIAATLGQQPNTVSCVSIQHPAPQRPAPPNSLATTHPWAHDVLSDIAEQLTAISEHLEHQTHNHPPLATKTVLLNNAQSALGVAFNCIRLYQQERERPLGHS